MRTVQEELTDTVLSRENASCVLKDTMVILMVLL